MDGPGCRRLTGGGARETGVHLDWCHRWVRPSDDVSDHNARVLDHDVDERDVDLAVLKQTEFK